MTRRGGWLLLLLLCGCAQNGVQSHEPVADKQSRAAVHTDLGAGYYSRGQYEVALQELNEASRIDPEYANAYNIFGLVYMALHENSIAEQNFQRALRLSPKDSEINNNYGWFLCQTGHEAESIKHFQLAVENPLYQSPEIAYLDAGVCTQKLGDDARAKIYFLKALEYRQQIPQALMGLAEINFKAGQYESARGYLQKLSQMTDATAKSLWLGVRIERRLHDRNAEASYAIQLKNHFPESPETQDLINGKYD